MRAVIYGIKLLPVETTFIFLNKVTIKCKIRDRKMMKGKQNEQKNEHILQ